MPTKATSTSRMLQRGRLLKNSTLHKGERSENTQSSTWSFFRVSSMAHFMPLLLRRTAKFNNVSSITLFVPASQGADTSRIYYVGFLGQWTEVCLNFLLVSLTKILFRGMRLPSLPSMRLKQILRITQRLKTLMEISVMWECSNPVKRTSVLLVSWMHLISQHDFQTCTDFARISQMSNHNFIVVAHA